MFFELCAETILCVIPGASHHDMFHAAVLLDSQIASFLHSFSSQVAGMPVLTNSQLKINHAKLKHDVIFDESLDQIRQVEDTWFIRLAKSDSKVRRLLMCACSDVKPHMLTSTSIIETLLKLRKDRIAEIENEARASAAGQNDLSDLEIDEPAEAPKIDLVIDVPKVVEVRTGPIGPVPGCNIKVLSEMTKTIYVEASDPIIDYLINVVSYQVNEEQKSSEHLRIPGATYVKDRDTYRVLYLEDGEKKYKYFRATSTAESEISIFLSSSSNSA